MSVQLSVLDEEDSPDSLMVRVRRAIPASLKSPPVLVDLNMNMSESNLDKVSGVNLLHQQIENVLGTLVGQEHFEPQFGSNVPLRVFAPVAGRGTAESMTFLLEADVLQALTRNMSDKIRVLHNQSSVTASVDGEGYIVEVVYVNLKFQQIGKHVFQILNPQRGNF